MNIEIPEIVGEVALGVSMAVAVFVVGLAITEFLR